MANEEQKIKITFHTVLKILRTFFGFHLFVIIIVMK